MRDIKCEKAEDLGGQDHRTHVTLQPSETALLSYGAHLARASPRLRHANHPQLDGDTDVGSNIATLSSHHSLSSTVPLLISPSSTSLKRPVSVQQRNDAHDGDGASMVEPEVSQKPTIHQDHQLLSFSRLSDQHDLFDLHGHVQTFELSLHLQGMFFLAESSTPAVGEPSYQQAELTCYRRNIFSVAGSVSVPRGPLSVMTDHGERATILSQELSVSAIESADGNAVRLIVIPWKTPPPNMSHVLPAKQDQEPPTFPLIPLGGVQGESAFCPIVWKRLQFRVATANNGRRKELQQHFVLRAKVMASLSNGSRIKVCEAHTAPIVVRGRSPRNFQKKKETSLGSKGHATSQSESKPVSLARDLPSVKDTDVQAAAVPQSSFRFDVSHLPRFPNWPSLSQQFEQTPSSSSSTSSSATKPLKYPRSRGSLNTFESKPEMSRHPSSSVGEDSPHFLALPPAAPLTIGDYSDPNPRPTKSLRHLDSPENVLHMYHTYRAQPDVASHDHLTGEPEPYARDYYVGAGHPGPWTSTGHAHLPATSQPLFQYSPRMFAKNEQHQPAQFPWSNA